MSVASASDDSVCRTARWHATARDCTRRDAAVVHLKQGADRWPNERNGADGAAPAAGPMSIPIRRIRFVGMALPVTVAFRVIDHQPRRNRFRPIVVRCYRLHAREIISMKSHVKSYSAASAFNLLENIALCKLTIFLLWNIVLGLYEIFRYLSIVSAQCLYSQLDASLVHASNQLPDDVHRRDRSRSISSIPIAGSHCIC